MTTNTPKACFWAVAYLLEHPTSHRKVAEETRNIFDCDGNPDLKALSECPYVSSLVSEVLRFASASVSMCVNTVDTVIGGKKIPAKSRVMVPTRELHFTPSVFGPTSDHFQPDRFVNDGNKDLTKSTSFRPFGGGISHCPGRYLAQQEIKMVVALLLKNWDIEIEPGKALPQMETEIPTTGVMAPKEGGDMMLVMKPRARVE
jgi:cytochrome P450